MRGIFFACSSLLLRALRPEPFGFFLHLRFIDLSFAFEGVGVMEFSVDITKMGQDAYMASQSLAVAPTMAKNETLAQIANMLRKMKSFIMEVNAKEVAEAQKRALPAPMLDRMTLTEARYNEMVEGIEREIALDDPIGQVIDGYTVPSGLKVLRRRVPLGVIGVIYESRPNVTVDIAALCLKSGNACILRGGSECFQTNLTLYELMHEVMGNSALPNHAVNFITATDRELVNKLLTLDEYVDVIIPRGGEALHRMCVKHATVPVIVGGFGVTHIYVDDTADIEKSVEIIINDKVQKPSACVKNRKPSRAAERLRQSLLPQHRTQMTRHPASSLHGLENCLERPWKSRSQNRKKTRACSDLLR